MSPRPLRIALLAACLVAIPTVAAQGAPGASGTVELLNQISVLRSELQALRAEIEELQRAQQQQADSARAQYLDLDGRLVRLEGGAPASPGGDLSGADVAAPVDVAPATPPAPAIAAPSADPAGEQADYLAAFDSLKRGDYVASARAFEDFLVRHPGGTYAPNALYWLGESYYVTQNYEMAERQFRAVISQFPRHDKAAGALLKVGLSQYGQGDVEAAAATLADVLARYPGTDVARTAEDSLRSMRLTGL